MRCYLMCEENGNRFTFTFTCYSNYEMVLKRK